jgi:hypothetical protein
MSKASELLSEMGMAWVSTRQLGRGMAFLLAFVPAATVSLPAVAFATEDAPMTDLAALRWQHRIILIAPEVPDAIKRLRAAASAIDERDIIWFVAHRDQLLSNYPGQTGVTLVQHLDERYFGPSGASAVAEAPLGIQVPSTSKAVGRIRLRLGVFYAGIVAGCSCADDPTPVDTTTEYCELLLDLDPVTGQARVSRCDD